MQSEQFSDLQFIQYFKGFELLRQWTMKHHSLVVDFSNLDFENIETEILTDEAKEKEETEADAIVEKDSVGRTLLEEKMLMNLLYPLHCRYTSFLFLFLFCWKTMVAPLFCGFSFYFRTSFYFLEHLLPLGFKAFV